MSPPFAPCLPTRAIAPPSGDEIKHDGYRLLAKREGERVTLRTRGGYDWAERYPLIVRSVLALRVDSIVLDGEVAVLGANGVSDFEALHSREADSSATLLAFDVLQLDSIDLRALTLIERKLLARRSDGLQLVEHLEGDGATIFAHACRLGLEGIVCKRADSPYRAGPSKSWLKVKNRAHPSIARVKEAIEAGRFRRR